MFKNYLKIAIRSLFKHKTYTIINIFGLSVGLACCILILLFIKNETSYDKFHKNADQIYRVIYEFRWRESPSQTAKTQAPLAPAILDEYPEVLNAVRFTSHQFELITYGKKQFWEKGIMLADPSVFDVFTFPLIEGDPKTALRDPSAIVLTEGMAKKYFGDLNPMGKILSFGDDRTKDYTVTGILKDIPKSSQLQFDCLISFENQRGNIGWGQWNYTTYILLPPGYSSLDLEKKFSRLVGKHMGEEAEIKSLLHLQPLTRIHLHSNLRNDLPTNRNITHVYLFGGVALLILLLASINFINLVTARSTLRGKEVGLRKVVGANQKQLVLQFLGESILLSLFAFLLSLILVELLLPIFNELSGKDMTFHFLHDFWFLMSLISLMFVVGILSGIYPAFVIARFQPASIFRKTSGSRLSGHSLFLRNFLVVTQFVISVLFLFSTAIFHHQMHFIEKKNLGYTREHLVVLPIFYKEVKAEYALLKSEVLRSAHVVNATATTFLPTDYGFYQNTWWEGLPEDDRQNMMNWLPVDHDFVKTLNLEIKSGRDFSLEYPTDNKGAYILNESAVAEIGWDDPLGKQFEIIERGKVVGIVKDFHFQSLHHKIQPLALTIYPQGYKYLLVKVKAGEVSESLQFLEEKWKEFFPGKLFEYSFFEEDFDRIYQSETRLVKTFDTVSGLAILIACLGLFGLTSFLTVRRTKEIGIRKVLGAAVSDILMLLSKDIIKLVLLANVIALPLSYMIINRWLQNFAYRVDVNVLMFVLVCTVSLFTALATVAFQAVRAAMADPVDTLRYE